MTVDAHRGPRDDDPDGILRHHQVGFAGCTDRPDRIFMVASLGDPACDPSSKPSRSQAARVPNRDRLRRRQETRPHVAATPFNPAYYRVSTLSQAVTALSMDLDALPYQDGPSISWINSQGAPIT